MYIYSFYIMFYFTKANQEEKKIKSFSHVFWIIVTSGEEGIQNLVLFTKENNKCHYVIRLMVFYICVLFIYLLNFIYVIFFFEKNNRTYVFRCKGEEKKKRSLKKNYFTLLSLKKIN